MIIKDNMLLSQYMLDKFKLWVWDFDDCIIDTATYYNKSMNPSNILKRTKEELTIDIPNWEYFRDLVLLLVSRGIRVSIASFGTYKIIKAYMDRIFGFNQKIFDCHNLKALCRDSVTNKPLRFHNNKNEFIDEIMEHYRIYEPVKVIFFDDNITNIAEALDVGIVSVKIKGKHPNNIKHYANNTEDVFFSKKIMMKLESTFKDLEKIDKEKAKCNYNNLKNERFSSIGDRVSSVVNEAKKAVREKFLQKIKKLKQKDNVNEALEEEKNLNLYFNHYQPKSKLSGKQLKQNFTNIDVDGASNNNIKKYKIIIMVLIVIIIAFLFYNL